MWKIHSQHPESESVAKQTGLDPVVASILLRRGHRTPAEIRAFLKPELSGLEDPFIFTHMARAVDRIQKAVKDREKILVYGDYDVDGVTAASILFPYLKKAGADVSVHLPHRLSEGYGLNRGVLEEWLKKKISLVITVDNGMTALDEARFLAEKGVDLIIVDHHIPKGDIPPAHALISCALPGGKGDENLAACGLAFKLIWALAGRFEDVKSYLDLVALGTVADLAPVKGDNRILLKHGLEAISQSRRPGLRALMDAAGIHPSWVSYRDIAFGLGPRINAAGRMSSAMSAFNLLTTEDALEARNLAEVLEAGNRERQRVESHAYKQAVRLAEEAIGGGSERVLVVESPEWHEGILGIVASRLVDRFRRPAVVISLKNGVGKGSGRSLPHYSLFKNLSGCSELFEAFGGHDQACGLTIRAEKVGDLRQRLNQARPEETDAAAEIWIDAELSPSVLNMKFLKDLGEISPYGPGNPRPLFLSRGMRLKSAAKKRGKDTLQCWMTDSGGKVTCEVIGFRAHERWTASMADKTDFDIVYQPSVRISNGISFIQLELETWK